jgi:hypothetical protein
MRRRLAAVAALVTLAGGLSACGGDKPSGQDIAAIDVPAAKIASVSYTANGKTATFLGKDGTFSAGPGATVESATLLNTSETSFPVLAYRTMDGVDAATPDFGLVSTASAKPPKQCGTGCSMTVTATDGSVHHLLVGAQTFNFGGYYARVEGDPRVFLIISATVEEIISMATGRSFSFPETQQELQLDATTQRLTAEASGKGSPEANYDPFLRQVLGAEADAKAAKEGRPVGALMKAATSTQDQPGSDNGAKATAAPANSSEGTDG